MEVVKVADDAALRMRRTRAHRAGDHSLCRSGCESSPVRAGAPSVAESVRAVIDALGLVPGDPRAPTADYALALAVRFDRGEPTPSLRAALEDLARVASVPVPRSAVSDDEVTEVLGGGWMFTENDEAEGVA